MTYYVRGNKKHCNEIAEAFAKLGLDTNDKTFDDSNKVYFAMDSDSDPKDNTVYEANIMSAKIRILRELEELGACTYLDF